MWLQIPAEVLDDACSDPLTSGGAAGGVLVTGLSDGDRYLGATVVAAKS